MKKLNKFFAVLVALAMMATLCVSMAFAADGDKQTKAPLVKTLTVPSGTAIPTGAKAVFTFSDLTFNGAASDRDTENAFLTTKTIKLDEDADGAAAPDTAKNVDVYTYTTEDLLAGIKWERPGVYEWTVSETSFTADDNNPATADHLNDDKSSYKIVVKVVYDEEGKLVVDEVIIKKGTDGTEGTEYNNENKANGVNFANAYYTTTGNPGTPDPEHPDDPVPPVGPEGKDDAGLMVKKVIDGDLGDKDTGFEITVTLALPQIDGADTAVAYIRDKDGNTTLADLSTGKVTLKHNETLVFTKIAEGTKYQVKETDPRKGTALNQYTATYTDQNDDTYTENAKLAVGKGDNAVIVSNRLNQEDTPPTGILISNLPYIALALVAIGGLVAYVVVRRRQDDDA